MIGLGTCSGVAHVLGLRIVASTLAREVRDVWVVEPHPIKKKRRGWRVVKRRIDRPTAFQSGNTIFMHPELIARLPKGEKALEGMAGNE